MTLAHRYKQNGKGCVAMWNLPIAVCLAAAPSRNPYEWIPLTPIEQMMRPKRERFIYDQKGAGQIKKFVTWKNINFFAIHRKISPSIIHSAYLLHVHLFCIQKGSTRKTL